jgi:ketosteroid isomerase-like protein
MMALAAFSSAAFAGDATGDAKGDEAEIRAIVTQDLVPGLEKGSPDRCLRSYLPDARVFTFTEGVVGVPRYREVLVEFFRSRDLDRVTPTFLYVRVEGKTARMAVSFREEGRFPDGSPHVEVYKRYYLLERGGGGWAVRTDGYNESLKEIRKFHGGWTGSHGTEKGSGGAAP